MWIREDKMCIVQILHRDSTVFQYIMNSAQITDIMSPTHHQTLPQEFDQTRMEFCQIPVHVFDDH